MGFKDWISDIRPLPLVHWRNSLRGSRRKARNVIYAGSRACFKWRSKIIYALTPPPSLENIGDHAQVVAIRAWMKRHFPTLPVIEVDKDQVHALMPALRWLVNDQDVFFLHSGGNLGDRGRWSESGRRLLIRNFRNNKIISLPQTIFFSDTEMGRQEQEKSCQIYNQHPKLTVIGRDPHSGTLAQSLFPEARTFCMPDFVLSLDSGNPEHPDMTSGVLLCLRHDNESVLSEMERQKISKRLAYPCDYFDTALGSPIPVRDREIVLQETLDVFRRHAAVVTDRYHGLIFAVLCRRPCVVLRTIDHKLTSAMDWFADIPFVKMAHTLEEIPVKLDDCLRTEERYVPDWNSEYFDKIPRLIA